MITIIHGEDTAKSRVFFINLKQKTQNSQLYDGEKILLTDLIQVVSGRGLFGESPAVFIDGLFAKRKPGKELSAIVDYLKTHEADLSITLWEEKTIGQKILHSIGNPKVYAFDFPKEIFAFLASLSPGNRKTSLELFHKVLSNEEIEFVFFMIVRQIRILLFIQNESGQEKIDEVIRLSPWQKNKMKKQAETFGNERLLSFYNELYKLETMQKTGQLSTDLTEYVDFLLSKL